MCAFFLENRINEEINVYLSLAAYGWLSLRLSMTLLGILTWTRAIQPQPGKSKMIDLIFRMIDFNI